MASINTGRAVGTLTSFRYFKMVGLLLVGGLLGGFGQEWLQNNVYDVGMTGGDAIYSIVMAAIILTFVGGRTGTYLAAGTGLGGAASVGQEMGFL